MENITNRKFDSMIFHGVITSIELEEILINRIKRGHHMLCGLQQGATKEEVVEGEDFIKDVCRDVLASFGYSDKGIKWKKLPYPGTLNYESLKEHRDNKINNIDEW